SEESRISKDVEANQIRLLTIMLQLSLIPYCVAGTCDETLVHVAKNALMCRRVVFVVAGDLFGCMLLRSVDTSTTLQIVSAFDMEHVKGFSLEGQSKAGADIVVITREWNSLALLTRKPIKSRPLRGRIKTEEMHGYWERRIKGKEDIDVIGSEKITLPNESVPANEPYQIRKITRKMTLKEYDKELDEKMIVLVCLESKEQKLALDKYLQVLTMRINSCTIV
ncbi:hypothetical protein Tco_1355309, partial [Tanacetum coccineum]